MGELTDLREEIQRLGVPAHVHDAPQSGEPCPPGEACIREPLTFIAHVRAPAGAAEVDVVDVEVDTMTAWGVLRNLPDNAGFDQLWAALVEIDHGA